MQERQREVVKRRDILLASSESADSAKQRRRQREQRIQSWLQFAVLASMQTEMALMMRTDVAKLKVVLESIASLADAIVVALILEAYHCIRC